MKFFSEHDISNFLWASQLHLRHSRIVTPKR